MHHLILVSRKRIGGDPTVFNSRVGHTMQFADRGFYRAGHEVAFIREKDGEFLDEFPFQLPKRDIGQMIFFFEKFRKVLACSLNIFECTRRTIFADTFLKRNKIFIEGLQ